MNLKLVRFVKTTTQGGKSYLSVTAETGLEN